MGICSSLLECTLMLPAMAPGAIPPDILSNLLVCTHCYLCSCCLVPVINRTYSFGQVPAQGIRIKSSPKTSLSATEQDHLVYQAVKLYCDIA